MCSGHIAHICGQEQASMDIFQQGKIELKPKCRPWSQCQYQTAKLISLSSPLQIWSLRPPHRTQSTNLWPSMEDKSPVNCPALPQRPHSISTVIFLQGLISWLRLNLRVKVGSKVHAAVVPATRGETQKELGGPQLAGVFTTVPAQAAGYCTMLPQAMENERDEGSYTQLGGLHLKLHSYNMRAPR